MVTSKSDGWTDDDHGAYARDGSGGPEERSVSGSDGVNAAYIYATPHPLSAIEQKAKECIKNVKNQPPKKPNEPPPALSSLTRICARSLHRSSFQING